MAKRKKKTPPKFLIAPVEFEQVPVWVRAGSVEPKIKEEIGSMAMLMAFTAIDPVTKFRVGMVLLVGPKDNLATSDLEGVENLFPMTVCMAQKVVGRTWDMSYGDESDE